MLLTSFVLAWCLVAACWALGCWSGNDRSGPVTTCAPFGLQGSLSALRGRQDKTAHARKAGSIPFSEPTVPIVSTAATRPSEGRRLPLRQHVEIEELEQIARWIDLSVNSYRRGLLDYRELMRSVHSMKERMEAIRAHQAERRAA